MRKIFARQLPQGLHILHQSCPGGSPCRRQAFYQCLYRWIHNFPQYQVFLFHCFTNSLTFSLPAAYVQKPINLLVCLQDSKYKEKRKRRQKPLSQLHTLSIEQRVENKDLARKAAFPDRKKEIKKLFRKANSNSKCPFILFHVHNQPSADTRHQPMQHSRKLITVSLQLYECQIDPRSFF